MYSDIYMYVRISFPGAVCGSALESALAGGGRAAVGTAAVHCAAEFRKARRRLLLFI